MSNKNSSSTSYVVKDGRLTKTNLNFLSSINSIIASLICIVIGLLVGLIILLFINPEHAFQDGFLKILLGGFNNISATKRFLGTEIAQTAPLIMTGLSVAFAFKTGLFNIGAAGQYTLGAFGALYFAIVLHMPWYVCLLMAMVFGAVWGAIPGLLKAFFNVNEVITSIMFNWIGLYAVNEAIKTDAFGKMYDLSKNKSFTLSAIEKAAEKESGQKLNLLIPDLGMAQLFSNITTIAIFIAIIIAIVMYIVLNKTTFGFELKACGHNKEAAKYAGINEKRSIVLSMVIAGALAGLGAGLYYLSGVAEWNPNDSTALPAMGFNGIPVALLALSNPIGVIFAAAFISHITTGGGCMPTSYFQPEIADVIVGVIIYLCAFVMLFKEIIAKFIKHNTGNVNDEKNAKPNKGAEKELAKGDTK